MPYAILYNHDKREEEIRKAIKDIIASYCFDAKQFELDSDFHQGECEVSFLH